jgi:hypothetical protein
MTEIINQPNYTIRAAALRTQRSTRSIKQWLAEGMPCREVAGMVVIDHDDLMNHLRSKIIRQKDARFTPRPRGE